MNKRVFSNNLWTSLQGISYYPRDVRLNYFDVRLKTNRYFYEVRKDIEEIGVPYYTMDQIKEVYGWLIRIYLEPKHNKKKWMEWMDHYSKGFPIEKSTRNPDTKAIIYKTIKMSY